MKNFPSSSSKFLGGLAVLLCLLAACELFPLTPLPPPPTGAPVTDTPTAGPPTSTLAATSTAASATAAAALTPTLPPGERRAAALWFAPFPPLPPTGARPFTGAVDFMDLFADEAAWQNASQHLGVFQVSGEWVAETAKAAELTQMVEDLKRRGLALAIEVEALDPTSDCGQGLTGFTGMLQGHKIAQRLQDAGGKLDYIAFQEPYYYAHLYAGRGACQWSVEQTAIALAKYTHAIRTVFPDVLAGDVEPLPLDLPAVEYRNWLQAYASATRQELAFFHLKPDFRRIDWPEAVLQVQEYARQQNIPFGVIYYGQGLTDQEWSDSAWQRAGNFESRWGGQPDHAIFQSWEDKPDHSLPENKPSSFTYLINRYFRQRTTLQAQLGDMDSDGARPVSGILQDASGAPIGQAPIQLDLQLQYQNTILNPPVVASYQATTNGEGRFEISLPSLPAMGVFLQTSYPGSDSTSSDGSIGFWPAFNLLNTGNSGRNVASHTTTSASFTYKGNRPEQAVDGDPNTIWTPGDLPRHFIEIYLNQPTTISMVRLLVSQTKAGWTTHWIWGKDSSGEFRLLQEVGSETADMDVIDVIPETPWENMTMIRVETIKSPAWVAWREIEIVAP